MKTIVKLIYIFRLRLPLVLFMLAFFSNAQKKSMEMPSLDDKKNVYTLKFSKDPENQNIMSAYMEGETEPDSIRFKAEISKVMERVMVTVVTENPDQEIQVDIVKNNWGDVKRSGKTKKGSFQISFDTAEKFGVVLSSNNKKIPFHMAVWTSGQIIPESSLFYSVDGKLNGISNTALATNVSSQTMQDSPQNNRSTILQYGIFGLLIIVVVLLLVIFLRKKSNKVNLLLIILISSQVMVFGKARKSNSSGFRAAVAQAFKQSKEYADLIYKIDDFASSLNALQKGFETFSNFLDDLESNESIDLDPAGQPRLPSSCLSSYNSSNSNGDNSTGNGDGDGDDNNWNENEPPGTGDDTNENAENQDKFQPMEAAGSLSNDKPDNGPGEMPSSNRDNLQLPRYDQNGNLINAGDFPDAPTHISTSGNERTKNPYIDYGTNSSQSNPTYDRNGHLKYPEEFPDAPRKIDISTGLPIMRPVLQGQNQQGPQTIKQPLYDKNGTLIDAGDYPSAPSKIDPRKIDANAPLQSPFTGGSSEGISRSREPKEQSQNTLKTNETDNNLSSSGNGGTSGPSSMSINNPNNTRGSGGSRNPENGKGPGPGEVGGPGNPGDGNGPGSGSFGGPGNNEGDKSNTEGCKCLKIAYKKLEETRLRLETLRVYTARIDRITNYQINWGDDVSSVHGVIGIVWQEKKVQILEAMKKYDRTYDFKYDEMIADLYKNLIEINRCEALLGFENWYSNAGFIYYEFMKDKYNR
jgi:hypothetical protein